MKLTFFLLMAALVHCYAHSSAQTVTLSGKDLSLKKIFSAIEKQTGFVVLSDQLVDKHPTTISLTVYDMELRSLLDMVLKDQPFKYVIAGKTIFLSEKKLQPVDVSSVVVFSPPEPIRGVITDSLGIPLSGATIVNKKNKKTVQSNAKGEFSIDAEVGDILMCTFVGYESQAVKVTGNSIYTVLKRSSSPLDEVQVIAYGTSSRRLSTGNITTIKGDEIARQPVDNPLLALMGRVPNLIITPQNGNPNSFVGAKLRGQNSLVSPVMQPGGAMPEGAETVFGTYSAGGTSPLILVDGLPYTNQLGSTHNTLNSLGMSGLSLINPQDIASIDVLADADATAIYGSRGANGVILITTKRGKQGATAVNVDARHGISLVTRKAKLLNTEQYLEMRRQAFNNDGVAPQVNSADEGYAPDLLLWDQHRYTDWQEELMGGTAKNTNVNVSISGGTPQLQYLLSGTYLHQGYVYPGAFYDQKATGHFSMNSISANQRFRVNLQASYTSNNQSIPGGDPTSLAFTLAPNAPSIYQPNGTLNWAPNPYLNGVATWVNPYSYLEKTSSINNTALYAGGELSYSFGQSLVFKTSFGFSEVRTGRLSLVPLTSMDPSKVMSNRGLSVRANGLTRSASVEPQLNYNKMIGQGRISVLLGTSFQSNNHSSEDITYFGYTNDLLLTHPGSATSSYSGARASQYRYVAAFGRVNFNWDDKYILNLNGRRDGSSRFAPQYQFGNFWSTGFAWLLSNEELFKKRFSLLSFAKLRGSYGVTGNDQIGDYKYLELYDMPAYPPIYQGISTLASVGATSPYYRWEQVYKAELALETGFLHDRILFTVAAWRNRSSSQLGTYELPATGGAPQGLVANMGSKIQNSGWDFTLQTKNIQSKKFNWATNLVFSWQNNKLLALDNRTIAFIGNNYLAIGQDPVGQPFTNIDLTEVYAGVNPALGVYQFKTYNGNVSAIRVNASQILSLSPKYTGGVGNSFNYRQWSLDVFMSFAKQTGYNPIFTPYYTAGVWESSGITGNVPAIFTGAWKEQGQYTGIQKFSQQMYGTVQEAFSRAKGSDFKYVDASYIKLQNASLSYTFSEKMIRSMKIRQLRVYMQAQNLFTLSPYDWIDPQVQGFALPPLTTITAGIQVGL